MSLGIIVRSFRRIPVGEVGFAFVLFFSQETILLQLFSIVRGRSILSSLFSRLKIFSFEYLAEGKSTLLAPGKVVRLNFRLTRRGFFRLFKKAVRPQNRHEASFVVCSAPSNPKLKTLGEAGNFMLFN